MQFRYVDECTSRLEWSSSSPDRARHRCARSWASASRPLSAGPARFEGNWARPLFDRVNRRLRLNPTGRSSRAMPDDAFDRCTPIERIDALRNPDTGGCAWHSALAGDCMCGATSALLSDAWIGLRLVSGPSSELTAAWLNGSRIAITAAPRRRAWPGTGLPKSGCPLRFAGHVGVAHPVSCPRWQTVVALVLRPVCGSSPTNCGQRNGIHPEIVFDGHRDPHDGRASSLRDRVAACGTFRDERRQPSRRTVPLTNVAAKREVGLGCGRNEAAPAGERLVNF